MVVDDEFLVAAMIASDLAAAGAEVVGPEYTVVDAAAAVLRGDLTGAVLDVQIGCDLVFPVAEELSKRQIPFVFYTGFEGGTLAARWPDHTVVRKPASACALIEALALALRQRPNAPA